MIIQRSENQEISNFLILAIALLCTLSLVLRFSFLGEIPGAPYFDEAETASNVMCLSQQGTSASGQKWPLFAELWGGNWESPLIIYPAALIALVGDGSIASFRLFPGLVVVLTIVGLFLIARELSNLRTAMFAALLAFLSPWSFVAGRLFWKCPLAPLFVIWGVYLFVLALRTRNTSTALLSALAFSLSLYSYQSAWAQTPLVIAFMLVLAFFQDRQFAKRLLVIFTITVPLACLPVLILAINGDLMQRVEDTSVFRDGHFAGLILFLQNFLPHFSPSFLYFSGDTNLRHGMGGLGQLSWLDLLALVLGVPALLYSRRFQRPQFPILGLLAIAGTIAGTFSAALTIEGIPHALRANGMWPFFALLGAWLIAQAPIRPRIDIALIAIASCFLAWFTYYHFAVYRDLSRPYFDDSMQKLAVSEDPTRWQKIATIEYPYVAGYYIMHYGQVSCREAFEFITSIRK